MTRLFLAVLLALLPGFASAQQQTGEKIVLARCTNQGCSCLLSDIDADTLSLLFGPDLPKDAIRRTLVIYDGEAILSPLPPDEVDLLTGGSGQCPLALADPVVPEDGLWSASVRVQSMQGCLPQVMEMVPPMVAAMANERRIRWEGGFHPAKLADAGGTARWSASGPERFTGHIKIPESGPIAIKTGLTARLVSPRQVVATLRLTITSAPGTDPAALAMIGMADCQTFAVYDFNRIGD